MTSSLIILLELGLFSLLLLLAFRVISLNRNEPMVPAMAAEPSDPVKMVAHNHPVTPRPSPAGQISKLWSDPEPAKQPTDKCELISQLHILASLQVRDCKQQELDLQAAHVAVREYAVCWLHGAACALSRPAGRDSDVVAMVVSQFASRKLGIRQPDALSVIATLTRHSAALACFRSGVEGAEFWKAHHFVPRDKSLFDAVTSNTFV